MSDTQNIPFEDEVSPPPGPSRPRNTEKSNVVNVNNNDGSDDNEDEEDEKKEAVLSRQYEKKKLEKKRIFSKS